MATFKNFRRGDRDRRDSARNDSSSSREGDASSPNTGGNLPKHLQRLREIEQEGEPLSLAEELADMMAHHREEAGTEERYEELKKSGFQIADLQKMTMGELMEEARKEKLEEVAGVRRQDLIFRILKERVKQRDAGNSARWLRLSPQPRLPLPVVPGRHLCFAQPDSAVWLAHRLHRGRANSSAEGKRAVFRAAASRSDQFSGSESRFGPRGLR